MEEVFLKVGEYANSGMKALNKEANEKRGRASPLPPRESPRIMVREIGHLSGAIANRNTGPYLIWQQFYALMIKHILNTIRNPIMTASQILASTLLAILAILILKSVPNPSDMPPLVLDLAKFKGTTVPYVGCNESTVVDNFLQNYQHDAKNRPLLVPQEKFSNDSTYDALSEYLLDFGKKNLQAYSFHMAIGATFNGSCANRSVEAGENRNSIDITAFYNNRAYHTPAIALAAVDSAYIKTKINASYELQVTNHPLPRTIQEQGLQDQYRATEPFNLAQNIMFSMSFLAASYSVFLVKERSVKAKHLQQVSGVRLPLYWVASFLWDFLIFAIAALGVFTVYSAFGIKGFVPGPQKARLLLVFFFYGLALIPFVYALQFLFDVPATAYVRICLLNIIAGMGSFIAVTVTELPTLDLLDLSRVLDNIFSVILPNYNLGRSFYNLYQNYQFNSLCDPFLKFCPKCSGPDAPSLCR